MAKSDDDRRAREEAAREYARQENARRAQREAEARRQAILAEERKRAQELARIAEQERRRSQGGK